MPSFVYRQDGLNELSILSFSFFSIIYLMVIFKYKKYSAKKLITFYYILTHNIVFLFLLTAKSFLEPQVEPVVF